MDFYLSDKNVTKRLKKENNKFEYMTDWLRRKILEVDDARELVQSTDDYDWNELQGHGETNN